jgi:hypothetical protein
MPFLANYRQKPLWSFWTGAKVFTMKYLKLICRGRLGNTQTNGFWGTYWHGCGQLAVGNRQLALVQWTIGEDCASCKRVTANYKE